jgi:hypothetical protein
MGKKKRFFEDLDEFIIPRDDSRIDDYEEEFFLIFRKYFAIYLSFEDLY